MDITPTTTIIPSKSPEPESEQPTRIFHPPPAHPQPTKSQPVSNGFLKRHHHHHHVPIVITYMECLKNHAATHGLHALDGCGEFMPSPSATPTNPTSLKCAACGCHRNFHRREPDDHLSPNSPPPPPTTTLPLITTIEYQPLHRHRPPPPPNRCPNSSSPLPISSSSHMLFSLSSDINTTTNSSSFSRKRSRTKFSQTQKEKMFQLAEKIRWKMQRRDEDLILKTCNEIQVDRGVFKVWMHNNKNTLRKRVLFENTTTTTTTTALITNNDISGKNGKIVNSNGNNNNNNNSDSSNEGSEPPRHQLQQLLGTVVGSHVIATAETNGGSSS